MRIAGERLLPSLCRSLPSLNQTTGSSNKETNNKLFSWTLGKQFSQGFACQVLTNTCSQLPAVTHHKPCFLQTSRTLARFTPNKDSHFQTMESKALESWSSYHVSSQQGIQGLFWAQYINTTALTPWLLKQKSHCCCYRCPLQHAVHEQCWEFYSASHQTGQESFQNDLSSRLFITKLGSHLGFPPYCLLSPVRTQGKEGPPGITFPTGQAGAWTTQLHFSPKSNLRCFIGNASLAGQWICGFAKTCMSPSWMEEPAARWSSQCCWRHMAPTPSRGCSEAAWKCSENCGNRNTPSWVFWRRGNNPFRGPQKPQTARALVKEHMETRSGQLLLVLP